MMPAPGEMDLDTLLKSMKPSLHPDTFAFATQSSQMPLPSTLKRQMVFQETEGTTIITTKESAEEHKLSYTFESRMITLNVQSSLDAVGFMAKITTRLAEKGMGVNPVSGFFHDHLFVPVEKVDEAMEVLKALIEEA